MEAKQRQMSWWVLTEEHAREEAVKSGTEKMAKANNELHNANRIHTEHFGLPTYSHEGL